MTAPPELSQAELFAALVSNMLEPLRADMSATLKIVQQCFEAVVRVECQLERQQLEIDVLRGQQATTQQQVNDIAALQQSMHERLKVVEAQLAAKATNG